MIKPILFLFTFVLLGKSLLAAATPLAPGQVWAYETRASEPQSRVAILRIDTYPKDGRVIHVAVTGLRLRRTPTGSEETWQIGRARLSEAAFRKSVTKLDPTAEPPVVPDFEEEHTRWKAAADRGDVQYWRLPLRDVVQQMEKWIQGGKN